MVTLFVRRVAGSDLNIAVYRAVYTEVNARLQLQAQGLGEPLNFLTPEEGRMADDANRAALAAVAQEGAGKVGVRNHRISRCVSRATDGPPSTKLMLRDLDRH